MSVNPVTGAITCNTLYVKGRAKFGGPITGDEQSQFLDIMAPDVANTSVHTDRNPNNNDDSSAGHKAGDVWIYNGNNYSNIWMCYKADVGNAQWAQLWTND